MMLIGFIKFIGNYDACMEKLSEFSAELFASAFKSAEISLKDSATFKATNPNQNNSGFITSMEINSVIFYRRNFFYCFPG